MSLTMKLSVSATVQLMTIFTSSRKQTLTSVSQKMLEMLNDSFCIMYLFNWMIISLSFISLHTHTPPHTDGSKLPCSVLAWPSEAMGQQFSAQGHTDMLTGAAEDLHDLWANSCLKTPQLSKHCCMNFFCSPPRNTDMWTILCLRTTRLLTVSWTSGGRRAVRGWGTCTAGTLSTKTSLWASELRWLPSTSRRRSGTPSVSTPPVN